MEENTHELLETAMGLFQDGRLTQAADLCRQVLARSTQDTGALQLLGVINFQQGDIDAAQHCFSTALLLDKTVSQHHNNLGNVLYVKQDRDGAEVCYREALRLQPDYAEAYYNLGNLFQDAGDLLEAAAHYRQALAFNPHYLVAMSAMGRVLLRQRQPTEAVSYFRQAVQIAPDYTVAQQGLAEALAAQGNSTQAIVFLEAELQGGNSSAQLYHRLGQLYQIQNQDERAQQCFLDAIRLQPIYPQACTSLGEIARSMSRLQDAENYFLRAIGQDDRCVDAHVNLGLLLTDMGRAEEAVARYRHVLQIAPEHMSARANLGSALLSLGKPDEAIVHYMAALSLEPGNAYTCYNLGNALRELGELEAAAGYYRQAMTAKPDFAGAIHNLGVVFYQQGYYAQAVAAYRQALVLAPDFAEGHVNLAITLLLRGAFAEGWAEYEWRLHMPGAARFVPPPARWTGEPLAGKTIWVRAEQGFGDALQFIRYLPKIQAAGGQVIFACRHELMRLLRHCAGIDQLVESGKRVSADYQVALLSLPGIFHTDAVSIPAPVPYIEADPTLAAQWRARLGGNGRLKIGFVWAANVHNQRIRYRSCGLWSFLPLFQLPNTLFVSLQKGANVADHLAELPTSSHLMDVGNELTDFADTAAVIANLDLVITVDTAAAHLAGAMGKHTWSLLSFVPDWRWLLARDTSPWYPSMRLFRQTQADDWAPVFAHVAQELKRLLSPLKF